jgi:hypothetical protein
MNSPLEQVDDLHRYIRELHKIGSKMEAGQFFGAFRSLKRIEAEFERVKAAIITNAELVKVDSKNE